MIKVKVNNEYKDVVKIFCGGTLQKEITKVWSREAQEYVYESSVEYTGSLPITINANGDALLDYRIYGASGGVGVATENLYNNRTRGYYNNDNGRFVNNHSVSYWRIPVQKWDIIYANEKKTMGYGCCFYQGTYVPRSRLIPSAFPYTVPDGVDEVTNNYPADSSAMVTVNQATPTSYIPYGYKLPMTIGDGNTAQTVPVYIGENQLMEDEYVSYGEQKIYKRTENLFNINGLYSTVVVQGQTFTKPRSAYFFDVFSGTDGGDTPMDLQKSIPVTSGTYTLSFEESETNISVLFSDGETQTIITGSSMVTPRTFDVSSDGYISIRCENPAVCSVKKLQIVKASTAPEQYIPYLQPTDPPVPFPEIPTIDGTTVIDYDGAPKPSQMYVKYRR